MIQSRKIRLQLFYFLNVMPLLLFFGCREDRWENYSEEEKTEVIQGCQLLWPIEFTAKVNFVEYQMKNIKRLPRWIHVTVISGGLTEEVTEIVNFRPHVWYNFEDWPEVRIHADATLHHLFEIGDTMVKPKSSCSVFNLSNPSYWVSLYYPFRNFP